MSKSILGVDWIGFDGWHGLDFAHDPAALFFSMTQYRCSCVCSCTVRTLWVNVMNYILLHALCGCWLPASWIITQRNQSKNESYRTCCVSASRSKSIPSSSSKAHFDFFVGGDNGPPMRGVSMQRWVHSIVWETLHSISWTLDPDVLWHCEPLWSSQP